MISAAQLTSCWSKDLLLKQTDHLQTNQEEGDARINHQDSRRAGASRAQVLDTSASLVLEAGRQRISHHPHPAKVQLVLSPAFTVLVC